MTSRFSAAAVKRGGAEWAAVLALSLLLSAPAAQAQGQVPSNVYSYSRSSSFTYKASGMLETETVEPGAPGLCVVSTHNYDGYGNQVGGSSANCAGASGDAVFSTRNAATVLYAAQTVTLIVSGSGVAVTSPAGMFATQVTNVLGHQEDRTYDPRFGALLTLNGPNGLVTRVELDEFGRAVKQTLADGSTSTTVYCIIAGRGINDLSSNDASCAALAPLSGDSAEVPLEAVSYVQSRSWAANGSPLGPAARIYKDRAERVLREVAEAFDGPLQPTNRRVVAKDTTYNSLGRATSATATYFWASRSSTVASSADAGSSYTQVDALGRITQVDVVDPRGHYTVTTASAATAASARTVTQYSGLTTTVTNDQGQTRVEERYITGKTARITDNAGGQIAHQYDAFDNLIKTQDALQNLVLVAYDIRGRKLSITDPDAGTTAYAYNALGELIRQRNATQQATGTATTLAYDTLGRLTQRVEPEYTSTWSYDKRADGGSCMDTVPGSTKPPGAGKLCESNTSHGVNKKLKYDNLGRALQARTSINNGPSFGSSVSYDPSTGRVASQTYPSGLKLQYAYSERGYMTQLQLATTVTLQPLPASPGATPAAGVTLTAGTASATLWTAGTANAWGMAETQSLANGVSTRANFEAATGRLLQLQAGVGTATSAATNVLSHHYIWDSIGNLSWRGDDNGDGNTGAVTESFSYDSLNRLATHQLQAPAVPNLGRTVSLYYNAIGNLLYKSDVGNYEYPVFGNNGTTSNPRPHAVSRVVGTTFGTVSYNYDDAGNVTAADGGKWRSVSYTSFNLPDSNTGMAGAGGSPRYTWQYDESHQRIRETRVDGSGTRTTWSQHPDNQGGLGFEYEVGPTGGTHNRHYLSAGGQTMVLITTAALPSPSATELAPTALVTTTAVKLEYWHKDHLGSLVSTTDHLSSVTARYAYDPFGKRRFTSGQYDAFGTLVIDWAQDRAAGTDRGFTGHEHLDDLGVIHMNGRIYEPSIGRFMQADPVIQAPDELQSYNRYSYIWNNPLNGTDPSGFCRLGCFWQPGSKQVQAQVMRTAAAVMRFQHHNGLGQKAIDRYIMNHPWANQVGQIVVTAVASYYGGPWAGAGASATWTSYYSYQQTGDIKASMRAGSITFATAMAFYAVGSATTTSWEAGANEAAGEYWTAGTQVDGIPNVLGHAAVGCLSAEASHGSCKGGAMSGGFGAAYSIYGPQGQGIFAGTVQHAMVGGVTSVLGGGKFWDGAKTAAFGYLFNELLHQGDRRTAMLRSGYSDGGSTYPYDPPLEGVYPESLLLGGPIGRGITGIVEALSTTTLYRAVTEAELADIAATGGFRNLAGLESKYFSSTLEGAQKYADMAAKAFGDVMTIVKTRIPTSWITNTMRVEVDGGVPAVVVPTARLPGLKPPVIVKPGG